MAQRMSRMLPTVHTLRHRKNGLAIKVGPQKRPLTPHPKPYLCIDLHHDVMFCHCARRRLCADTCGSIFLARICRRPSDAANLLLFRNGRRRRPLITDSASRQFSTPAIDSTLARRNLPVVPDIANILRGTQIAPTNGSTIHAHICDMSV